MSHVRFARARRVRGEVFILSYLIVRGIGTRRQNLHDGGIYRLMAVKVMRERGVEPLRCYPLDPKSSASAISATLALLHCNGFPSACQTPAKLKEGRL